MKGYQNVMVFIGNFSPIFCIVYIVYIGLLISWWLVFIVLALFSNVIWLFIFSERNLTRCDKQHYKILEYRDIGNDVIAYFLSYSIALPSTLFLSPLKGLAVLLIIMILLYALFNGAKIMFFNPFLVALGFHEMEIKTGNGAIIYLISKRKPIVGEELTLLRLQEYVYYLETIFTEQT